MTMLRFVCYICAFFEGTRFRSEKIKNSTVFWGIFSIFFGPRSLSNAYPSPKPVPFVGVLKIASGIGFLEVTINSRMSVWIDEDNLSSETHKHTHTQTQARTQTQAQTQAHTHRQTKKLVEALMLAGCFGECQHGSIGGGEAAQPVDAEGETIFQLRSPSFCL